MPVYWFALSEIATINWADAVMVFIILHLLVYPASNGYNSYMDMDETPIGGVEKPLKPTKQLFYVTALIDAIAIILSIFVNKFFCVGICIFILASRAYSYRGIRLKKYPIIGYLTVVFFQGAVVFCLVYTSCSTLVNITITWQPVLIATLLIGGFYPLTQIYQHVADKKDGVVTISYLLGYKGTFIFTAFIYTITFCIMVYWFTITLRQKNLIVIQLFFIPILIYFFYWAKKVWINNQAANFKNTMCMNKIASVCTNIAFIINLILHLIE
jgi:1,4-dihydroxy-2-naphthoate octaprenyltransferase